MSIREIKLHNKKEVMDSENVSSDMIKKINGYSCMATANEGIFKILDDKGGYLVRLDYGRELRLDSKTGTYKLKQIKTNKRVATERDAKRLRREAEEIRERRKKGESLPVIKKVTMSEVFEEFRHSTRYSELGVSYRDTFDNYIRHFNDFFGGLEPCKVTSLDIENYFKYEHTKGSFDSAVNKDGSLNRKLLRSSNPKGLSVNTLYKHKCALKKIWDFMIESKKYNIESNVVCLANIPKQSVNLDGKQIMLSSVPYTARNLTLDELNYILNDAIQHEDDRSIAVMIALGSIGGLRRGEVVGLRLGKFDHGEYMNVSDEILDFAGYDKEYYREHDNFMLIDESVIRVTGGVINKLPKRDKIRVVAVPNCLRSIVNYALEQRKEIFDIIGKEFTSSDQVYLPIINIINEKRLTGDKLSRRWMEYQQRRNKRMRAAGLEELPIIRFHDLRQTHGNLLKEEKIVDWEGSFNMGHTIPNSNIMKKKYWNDRVPYREDIIEFFDRSINIDWSKALRNKVNEEGAIIKVNSSGHLAVVDEEKERIKRIRSLTKKSILTESELVELMFIKGQDLKI